MLYMAFRELVSRKLSTVLTLAGLLTSSLGFVVLAGTSQTTAAALTGDISKAWDTPYDILVRPHGSANALEQAGGSIRPNYLGGVYGGISESQLVAIRATDGVDVAAPVAVAGVIYQNVIKRYPVGPALSAAPVVGLQLIRQATGDAGLSRFAPTTSYYLAGLNGQIRRERSTGPGYYQLVVGSQTIECGSPPRSFPMVCWGSQGPCISDCASQTGQDHLFDVVAAMQLPIVIAGVDPVAEARLAGLDRCVSSGRYLTGADSPAPGGNFLAAPVLVSDHTAVDEQLHIQISRTSNPTVVDSSEPFPNATWTTLIDETVSADALYRATLDAGAVAGSFSNTWTEGDVTYSGSGDHITATTRPPDFQAFANPVFSATGADPSSLAPPEARDLWFRSVATHVFNNAFSAGQRPPGLSPVGRYDPSCLAGFNPLAGGRLETYAPATVLMSNGMELHPNASIGGYINLPPTILTNLAGIRAFTDRGRYAGASGANFISVIRVRVAGTSQVGPVAEARLSRVAARIREATGLDVDIVKGASPRSVQVDLPAGNFGRPAMTVSEPWAIKGVGFRFFSAVSGQNLAIFALILIAGLALVAQTAYLGVRRRRHEFAALRALGWPASRIAALIEIEMLLVGLAAAAVGLAIGLPLSYRLAITTGWWQVATVIPVSLAVAGIAALVPAIAAARMSPVQALVRGARIRRSRIPSSLAFAGIRELLSSWKAEAALGIGVVALGAALVGGVLLVTLAFRGQLDTTVLGVYLTGRVRSFHVVIAALTVAIGVAAAAEILALSYLERRPHLSALRALGWPRSSIATYLSGQAAVIGLMGGLLGAAVTVGVAVMVGAPLREAMVSAATGFAIAVLTAGLAVTVPMVLAYRSSVGDGLRGE